MNALLFTIGLFAASPAFAQQGHQPSVHSGVQDHARHQQGQSPYAGMHGRTIKAMSEQQLADIRAGKGMSLALPAELNGYPGPLHTLELADALGLSDGQKLKTQALFAQMQTEAKNLGNRVIERERELDRLFRDRTASVESIQAATAGAAQAQGQLRAAHLKYHLKMVEILTGDQIARYDRLRGYQ